MNSVSCKASGQHTGTAADRTCGPCRSGYVEQDGTCIDIEISTNAQENIGYGNYDYYAAQTATAVTQRLFNQDGYNGLVNIMMKITKVDVFGGSIAGSTLGDVAAVINALVAAEQATIHAAFASINDSSLAMYIASFVAQHASGLVPGAGPSDVCLSALFRSAVLSLFVAALANVTVFDEYVSAFNGSSVVFSSNGVDSFDIPAALSDLLPGNVPVSAIQYTNDTLFYAARNGTVATSVVSLVVSGLGADVTFTQRVTVTLKVKASANVTKTTNLTCAYYDFVSLAWQTDGVETHLVLADRSAVTCKTTHLTNFAVLLDYSGGESALSAADALALGLITTIGLCISVILMGLLIVFFVLVKAFRTKPKTVVVNLCVCLIVAQVVFLTSIDKTGTQPDCRVVALVMQYFLLAAFMVCGGVDD